MLSGKSWRVLPAIVALSIFLTGCNAFEAFDRNLNRSDYQARLGEAELELASANYGNALDLFERIATENGLSDDVLRGRASSQAGLAGFNMFSVLDKLQNDVTPPDTAVIFFSAGKLIKDDNLLNKAIEDMGRVSLPDNKDRLFRSLMACLYATRSILEKFDTNLNKKLDTPDQISFDIGDDKTSDWPTLFLRLTDSSSIYSLEKAYIELAASLDGRGEAWVTISPVQGVNHTGIYTPANRSTITATGNFAESLKEINKWFDVSEAQFKTKLMAIDGAN